MIKQDWILSDAEQAEMFPPEVVASEIIPSMFNQAPVDPTEWRKPQDFYTLSPVQRSLFDLDEEHFQERIDALSHFPKPIADFLAGQLKRRIRSYGSLYADSWFKSQIALQYERYKLVMSQYCDALSLFKMTYQDLDFLNDVELPSCFQQPERETEEEYQARCQQKIQACNELLKPIASRLIESEAIFKREHLRPLCYMRADELKAMANLFASSMSEEMHRICDENYHTVTDTETGEALFRQIYRKLVADINAFGIDAPYQSKVKSGSISVNEINSGLLKITDPAYWLGKLERMATRLQEHLAIAVGMVHQGLGGYVSNGRLKAYEQQRKNNFEFIKNCVITNILNEEEQHDLLEIWLKSSANPKIARIELMNRMRGFEEIADYYQHEGVFVTLTAPSKYHAMLHQGGVNPKWNGFAPHQTQQYLCGVWAKIRASLKRQNIQTYGFRVAEPHHDGTPHFHFVLYTKPEDMRALKRTIYRYALEEDGDEPGAKLRRCTFKKIDKSLGSATGYLAKYISKNIDGQAMDGLFSDETGVDVRLSALRTKAWATVWGIRQFQQIGGASISAYRELRKLGSEKQQDETVDIGRAISDTGCFASYTEFQGGVFVKRADQKVRLNYIEAGETKYQETRHKVNGVKNSANGKVTITRLKEWKIERKRKDWEEMAAQKKQEKGINHTAEWNEAETGELARPWTRVSNCTGSKNTQIHPTIRERIKNELIIQRGRITDYQVDDLLNGKPLKIYSNEQVQLYVTYSNGQLIEEKRYS
ncbi:replication endonuclease [Ursidibacter arcticus]